MADFGPWAIACNVPDSGFIYLFIYVAQQGMFATLVLQLADRIKPLYQPEVM